MGFFCKKNNPSGKYKDQILHGNILDTEFTYQCGYAVRNGVFPADDWTVVLYNKAVDVQSIKLGINCDIENFPNIYFIIKKDHDCKLYDINIWGVPKPGRNGIIVTVWLNKTAAVVFRKGELEITAVDTVKNTIEARMWAVTKDGKNKINGSFTISIAGELIDFFYYLNPSPTVNVNLIEPDQEMIKNDFDRLFHMIPPGLRSHKIMEHYKTKEKTDYIFLGIAPYPEIGYYALEKMPTNPEAIAFLGLPNQEEILEAFIQTEYAEKIRKLTFGCSSECPHIAYLETNFNYINQVNILSKGSFPNLRSFSLGEWWLFSNSSDANGQLGDISALLAKCESLEALYIYGHFELSRPLQLKKLKTLEVRTEGDLIRGLEPISQATFDNLLSQPLPAVESIYLSILCEKKQYYVFPEEFLNGQNTPNIKGLDLDAGVFLPVERERFKNSALAKTPGIRFYFDDEEE